jgi:hypothetical protein
VDHLLFFDGTRFGHKIHNQHHILQADEIDEGGNRTFNGSEQQGRDEKKQMTKLTEKQKENVEQSHTTARQRRKKRNCR